MEPVSSSSSTPVTSLPPTESRAGSGGKLTKNITRVGNTSVSLDSGKITNTLSGKLSNLVNSLIPHKNTIISLPAAVPLEESAILKKNISSTDAVFLYHIPGKGDVVVKRFGDDEIIDPEDRLFQEVNSALEVFVSKFAKILNVNAPHSWLISEPGKGNTSVASFFIKSESSINNSKHRGNEVLKNKVLFDSSYKSSKLPIFHYLINHPDITSSPGWYNNVIVREDNELISIDHADSLGKGRDTPSFTREQLHRFLPDRETYKKLKNFDLRKSMHKTFDHIFKKYGKSIDTVEFLSIEDFEFRKRHIIKQYDVHFIK